MPKIQKLLLYLSPPSFASPPRSFLLVSSVDSIASRSGLATMSLVSVLPLRSFRVPERLVSVPDYILLSSRVVTASQEVPWCVMWEQMAVGAE
jgi:hypothetical protein